MSSIRLKGWPRAFDCEQDYYIAKRAVADIRAVYDAYAGKIAPAAPEVLITFVELLDLRGFEKDLPEAAMAQIELDWIEDLSEFPADLVELACKNWRRSNVGRAPYASGELTESIKAEAIKRKAVFKKAKSVLEILEREGQNHG